MRERPTHDGFVPFVPPPVCLRVDTAPPETTPEERAATELAPAVEECVIPVDVPVENPERTEEVESPITEGVPEAASLPPLVRACTHEAVIRNEAVRLAAIACGRALRHVGAIHPQLIATFVDEAMMAAGQPAEAAVGVCELREDGDISVTFGEANVGIGADLDTRAELLVRAAASG